MPYREPQQEKPYDFVPLPEAVKRERPAGHDGFKPGLISGAISGELLALTPVHVASGNIEPTQDARVPLVKAHFRTGGKIAIPGSSLKGVVRSIAEAITPSCVCVQSRAARDKMPRGFEPCEVWDERALLCPACRIFGAMGYQGQVRFADAVLTQGDFGTTLAPSLFAPRNYSPLYYNQRGQVRGRKFYFHGEPARGNVPLEVCTVGSRYAWHLDFTNLHEAELGVLLMAMGVSDASFMLKLGGAKPVCRGSVEVCLKSIEIQDNRQAAMDFDAALVTADRARWLRAAEALIVRDNLKRLQAILRMDEDRLCPSETY
jgi:CRISPR/Cas system CSM-associated protein Csm3 (group 7 of RAMP superfamily)